MEPLFIQELNIKNFKGFNEVHFSFRSQFTVIIGDNGMGKTSVLDALAIAASLFLNPLAGGQKYQRTINKKEVRIGSEYKFSSLEPQLPCLIKASNDEMEWSRGIEKLSFTNTTKDARKMTTFAARQFRTLASGEKVTLPVFAYHGTGRLWAELNDKVEYSKQASRTEGYDYCFSAKSSSKFFRSWYKTLEKNADKKGDDVRILLDAFKLAIVNCVSEWDDLYYDFGEDDIIGVKGDGASRKLMPFRLMSDGFRSMISLVADIAYRAIKLNPHLRERAIKESHGLVLIDEIDLHLHPSWQRHIVGDLKHCFPKIQFVATTHSPFIVQSLTSGEMINLDGKELQQEPNQVSLETNALYMGVDSVNGTLFSEKEAAANRFFQLIQSPDEQIDRDEIARVFDKYAELYSDDPFFVAQLKFEKTARFTRQNDETNR